MLNAKKLLSATLLVILLGILAGCSHLTLDSIAIDPPDPPVMCGQEIEFRVIGFDKGMTTVPIDEEIDISVSPGEGVIVDTDVPFKGAVITFPASGNYLVRAIVGQLVDEASVEVICPELTRIEVSPSSLELMMGEECEVALSGYDQLDNPIAITGSIIWSVTGGIGTVDPADSTSTTFTTREVGEGTIRVDVGLLSFIVPVKVIPAPVLTSVLISPKFTTFILGKCVDLTVTPYDQYGNIFQTDVTPVWEVTGDIGTTSPSRGWTIRFCASEVGQGTIGVTCDSVSDSFSVEILDCG